MINLIVHDTTQGVLTGEGAADARIYGTLFYYNGYGAPDRGHGHGIYAQNLGSTPKQIYDNIIFQQFGWGIHAYGEGGHLDNLDFQGNISFNNGGLSGGWHANILVGGTQNAATNPKLQCQPAAHDLHVAVMRLGKPLAEGKEPGRRRRQALPEFVQRRRDAEVAATRHPQVTPVRQPHETHTSPQCVP